MKASRFLCGCVTLAVVLWCGLARASGSDANQLTMEASAGWTILGPSLKHATGGITPRITGDYALGLSDMVHVGFGADIAVFGLGGGARWVGVLGGPVVRFNVAPLTAPLRLDFAVAFDFGRIPECTSWEHPICPRFVGFFPAGKVAAFYQTDSGVAIGAFFAARIIHTAVGWSGSYEPGLAITLTLDRRQ